jgi:hypothetical protein
VAEVRATASGVSALPRGAAGRVYRVTVALPASVTTAAGERRACTPRFTAR